MLVIELRLQISKILKRSKKRLHCQQNLMQLSPPSSSQYLLSLSQQQFFDQISTHQTSFESINTFLNSYQILKKLETPTIELKPFPEKYKISHTPLTNDKGLMKGSSLQVLVKNPVILQIRKQQDQIIEKNKIRQQPTLAFNKSVSSDFDSQSSPVCGIKLPTDNQFTVLHSNIKCINLLTKIKCMSNGDNFSQRPMFTYPEWKQISEGVKKIFNKFMQSPMKELNTGTLISIRPKESLSIRTDYYCFHPHQVYTTFLALDKVQMNSGTLGFCRLSKQFVDTEYPKYRDEYELLEAINKQKRQIEWQYLQLKQGDLIIVGKDVLYGSFRNDSGSTKFYAQMRWVKHQSASNSSNSS